MPHSMILPPARTRGLVWGTGVLVGALVAAGVTLWAYFGGAVFFEMIAAGIAACL